MSREQPKILIADDDAGMRFLLENLLVRWGYTVVSVSNGRAAEAALDEDEDIALLVLDWVMPEVDGVELCRRVRSSSRTRPQYVILLTGRNSRQDLITGLDAGADDYLVKPFNPDELSARLRVGLRVVELQRELARRVTELETALGQVKQLRGLLPICSYCKRIRDDKEYWHDVESYLRAHADANFSHGICPNCFESIVQPELDRFHRSRAEREQSDPETLDERGFDETK